MNYRPDDIVTWFEGKRRRYFPFYYLPAEKTKFIMEKAIAAERLALSLDTLESRAYSTLINERRSDYFRIGEE